MRPRNILTETNDMRRLMGIPLLKEDTPAGFSLGFAKSGGLTIDEERDEFDDHESEVIGVDSDIEDQTLQKEDNDSMNEIEKAQKMAEERELKEKKLKEKNNKDTMEDNLIEQEPEIDVDNADITGDGEDPLDQVVAEGGSFAKYNITLLEQEDIELYVYQTKYLKKPSQFMNKKGPVGTWYKKTLEFVPNKAGIKVGYKTIKGAASPGKGIPKGTYTLRKDINPKTGQKI